MRRQDDAEESAGHDSFLDVVANIVGILILLIMVVGARAALIPLTAATKTNTETESTQEELNAAIREATEARFEVEEIIERTANMNLEAARRESERMQLQHLVSAVSAELEEHRKKLDEDKQIDYDLRRQLVEAKIQLEDLNRRELGMVDVAPEVEEIKSLPTPLAKVVHGEELHLRLAHGHVSILPVEMLKDALQDDVKQNLWRLEKQPSFTGTAGPIDGFRLRYLIREMQVTVPGRGTAVFPQVELVQFLPENPQLGVPVDQALMPGSALSTRLQMLSPTRTTVTVWVYPNSFQDFRTIKESLYERGYATAARPLGEGVLIGFSPHGTKSSAQ